jgi:hypothetical protein
MKLYYFFHARMRKLSNGLRKCVRWVVGVSKPNLTGSPTTSVLYAEQSRILAA